MIHKFSEKGVDQSEETSSLPTYAIALIVVVGLILLILAIVAVMVVCAICYRRKHSIYTFEVFDYFFVEDLCVCLSPSLISVT